MDSSIQIFQADSTNLELHRDLRNRAIESKLYVPIEGYLLKKALHRGTSIDMIYLLEKDGKPIGVAAIGYPSKKKGLRLLQIFVKPAYRQQGFGTVLLNLVENLSECYMYKTPTDGGPELLEKAVKNGCNVSV